MRRDIYCSTKTNWGHPNSFGGWFQLQNHVFQFLLCCFSQSVLTFQYNIFSFSMVFLDFGCVCQCLYQSVCQPVCQSSHLRSGNQFVSLLVSLCLWNAHDLGQSALILNFLRLVILQLQTVQYFSQSYGARLIYSIKYQSPYI